MKLDWQHVVILVAGGALVVAVIALGHGDTLLQVLAALGGASGLAALLKTSPIDAPHVETTTVKVTKETPPDAPIV